MYEVYKKYRYKQRAQGTGFLSDNLERTKAIADKDATSWWAVNGAYQWIKVKDHKTGKYIYTALDITKEH